MSFLHDFRILIIVLLLLLLIIAVLYIITLKRIINDGAESSHSGTVPQEKHNEILRERNDLRDQVKILKLRNSDTKEKEEIEEKYDKAYHKIEELNYRIEKLTRENNELKKLYNEDSSPNESDEKANESSSTVEHFGERNVTKDSIEGILKYASFPRSAGNTIYFSDLTDKLVDDSYFELRISGDKGKATFKPLDFMKIRNYDPAMAAILTDGVKPNIASTVVGVEPGEAYLEGKDWIINELAKIKLA